MENLRDEFAKAAMSSLIVMHYEQCRQIDVQPKEAAEVLADIAYQTADAMIKRRETV